MAYVDATVDSDLGEHRPCGVEARSVARLAGGRLHEVGAVADRESRCCRHGVGVGIRAGLEDHLQQVRWLDQRRDGFGEGADAVVQAAPEVAEEGVVVGGDIG